MSAAGKMRIIWLTAAAAVAVIIGVCLFAFRIQTVEVQGNERCTAEEIEAKIIGNGTKRNLIPLWFRVKFGGKQEIPFVETYDIRITGASSVQIIVYEKSIVGYFNYMGANMYFDKDGIIVETTDGTEEPGVPLIAGLDFDYAILHETLPVEKKKTFRILLDVTQMLDKYKLSIDKIFLTDNLEVVLYRNNVKVLLGGDEQYSNKLNTLKSFPEDIWSNSGTIDMTVYHEDGSGYILKLDKPLSEKQ